MIPDKAATMESMRQSFRGISWGPTASALDHSWAYMRFIDREFEGL
jgi:hypothetical protein